MNTYKFLILCAAAMLCFSCSSVDRAPAYPNMLADIEPFSLGSVNASGGQMFSSNDRELDIEVIFHPRQNEVVLEFRHGTSLYRQFWNQAGREQFIQALEIYKDDYANRRLIDRSNRTRSVYGSARGRFQWQVLSFSFTAAYQSSPVFELGYRFRSGSPYFTVNQITAREETGGNAAITESPQYPIFFTRAQADELAQLFDQDFLLETLGDISVPSAAGSARDEYYR